MHSQALHSQASKAHSEKCVDNNTVHSFGQKPVGWLDEWINVWVGCMKKWMCGWLVEQRCYENCCWDGRANGGGKGWKFDWGAQWMLKTCWTSIEWDDWNVYIAVSDVWLALIFLSDLNRLLPWNGPDWIQSVVVPKLATSAITSVCLSVTLSPHICIISCMAVSWLKMNEVDVWSQMHSEAIFCHKHWGLESSLITNLQLAYTKKYELRASMGSLANWQDKMNWWLEKCEWSSNQGCNEAMCDWWLRKECVVLRCGQEILKIEIIDGVGLEGNGMSCNGLMEWKSIPKHETTTMTVFDT